MPINLTQSLTRLGSELSEVLTDMPASTLSGLRTDQWFQLLWRHRFAIDPRYVPRALIILTGGLSPYMADTWPRRAGSFDRYLTMREASDKERDRWSAALRWYVTKLHFASGKIPMLKSPPHTARIWLLHQIFPDARFIHIHRHPERVFQSTRAAFHIGNPRARLQKSDGVTDDWLLQRFEKLHASYFQYRDRIPAQHLVEVPYTRLVADPISCIGEIYQQLKFEGFHLAESRMRQHLASLAGYRRNEHPSLNPGQLRRLADAARLCCDHWGYSMTPSDRMVEA